MTVSCESINSTLPVFSFDLNPLVNLGLSVAGSDVEPNFFSDIELAGEPVSHSPSIDLHRGPFTTDVNVPG